MSSRVVGGQSPRVSHVPVSVSNDCEDAAFLASSYGIVPDEWQRRVLEAFLGYRADGRFAASRCGFCVPRQNGKNGILEVIELFHMVMLGRRILHTSHQMKTSRQAFVRLCEYFDGDRYPEMAALVKRIRSTNGQEAVLLKNGGSCEFIARSKKSGRGFTVDTLVMDEAQEMSEDALAALLPTISASPSGNPQQIILGTPPGPSDDGDVFTRVREAGVSGGDDKLAWLEWSAPDSPDLDDPEVWAAANPALGIRLNMETLQDERAIMDDVTFMRERLGMWSTADSARVIPLADWDECSNPNFVDAGGPVALAVDVNPGRDAASIVACGDTAAGEPWLDVVETRRGTPDWLVDRVVGICERENVRAVMVDRKSPAAPIIDVLKRRGVRVTETNADNMATAAALFYDSVLSHSLVHLDQPLLNVAVGAARRRRIGDAWGWSRKDTQSDITPLVAATLALFGHSFSGVVRPRRRPARERNRKVVVL